MSQKLNTNLIKEKLTELGLNQTDLSKKLNVSREAVSQWLKNQTFPKPQKLLQLGKILDLQYSDIIEQEIVNEPVVAYRKTRSSKTKAEHLHRAKQAGYALEHLVPYLPASMLISPPKLIDPQNKYDYIQLAVKTVRDKFNLPKIKIEFQEIIDLLNSLNIILIPVLLGDRKQHENALHIFLPKSKTTWIYFNLDVQVFDFKFWLLHELAHVLTPDLKGNISENFADSFAGAFLFSEEEAEKKYYELKSLNTIGARINSVLSEAKRLVISPVTIQKEVNKFIDHNKLSKINFGKNFYGAVTNFNRNYQNISKTLFGKEKISANVYIEKSKKIFNTKFFDLLISYNKEKGLTEGFVSQVLNVSLIDAKEIYSILNATKKNIT